MSAEDDCNKVDLTERDPGALPEPEPVDPEMPDGSNPDPDPPGPTFIDRGTLKDLICQVGSLHPQILNGLFLNLLADHFSDPRYIWNQKLKSPQYQWRPGVDTGVRIMTSTQWNEVDRSNEELVIVIKRGPQQWQPMGIGGKGEDDVDGQVLYHMVTGSHTFFATGGSGAEAELMGDELAKLWIHESYRMTHEFFFSNFQPGELGSPGAVTDLGDVIGVPFSVAYAYQCITKTQPIQPTLKVFNVRQTLRT